VVDYACGVGYQAIQDLHNRLQSVSCGNARPLQARNTPEVQNFFQPPTWYGEDNNPASPAVHYDASVDGVFPNTSIANSNQDINSNFCMMDDDKIAVLIYEFFQELLERL
jgi:hypothetical protein